MSIQICCSINVPPNLAKHLRIPNNVVSNSAEYFDISAFCERGNIGAFTKGKINNLLKFFEPSIFLGSIYNLTNDPYRQIVYVFGPKMFYNEHKVCIDHVYFTKILNEYFADTLAKIYIIGDESISSEDSYFWDLWIDSLAHDPGFKKWIPDEAETFWIVFNAMILFFGMI